MGLFRQSTRYSKYLLVNQLPDVTNESGTGELLHRAPITKIGRVNYLFPVKLEIG